MFMLLIDLSTTHPVNGKGLHLILPLPGEQGIDARGWLTSGNYPYDALLPVDFAAHTPSEAQVLHARTVTHPCSEVYMKQSGVTRGLFRRIRTLSITLAYTVSSFYSYRKAEVRLRTPFRAPIRP